MERSETATQYYTNLLNVIVLGDNFDEYQVNDTNCIAALASVADKLNIAIMFVRTNLTMTNDEFCDAFNERFSISLHGIDFIHCNLGATTKFNYMYASTDIRRSRRAVLTIIVGENARGEIDKPISNAVRKLLYSAGVAPLCNFTGCPNTGGQHKFNVRGPVAHVEAVIAHINSMCEGNPLPELTKVMESHEGRYIVDSLTVKCHISHLSPLEV